MSARFESDSPAHIFSVKQHSSYLFKAQVRGELNRPVPGSDFTSVTLTLYDTTTNTKIRDAVDVLQQNDVTIDEDGWMRWNMQPSDNVIVSVDHGTEVHVALFEFKWALGEKAFLVELQFNVRVVQNAPPLS